MKCFEDGDGIMLFESEEWGGVKIYRQISPTLRANKVCAGVVLVEENKDECKVDENTPSV